MFDRLTSGHSSTAEQRQPLQTVHPATVNTGWRSGPEGAAGASYVEALDAFAFLLVCLANCSLVSCWCCYRLTQYLHAGRVCNVSELPLMCSSVNWASGEVVVGSSDHALYVVDTQSGKKRRTLYTKSSGHCEWVTACQYLSNGRVISGGMDSKLCLWEANSNRCQHLTAHAAPISAVDVSSASGAVVSASYDKSVRVWDMSGRKASESSCLTGHAAPVLQLACGNGDSVVTGDRGGTVISWGLATGSTTCKLKDAHAGHVTALAWHHDNDGSCTDRFFSGGQDGHLKM